MFDINKSIMNPNNGIPIIELDIVIKVRTLLSFLIKVIKSLYNKIPINPPMQFNKISSISDAPIAKIYCINSKDRLTTQIPNKLASILLSFLNSCKYIPKGINNTILPITFLKTTDRDTSTVPSK